MFIKSHVNTDFKQIFINIINFYIIVYIFCEAYFTCNYLYVLHSSMM
jgi:hypothetical protein